MKDLLTIKDLSRDNIEKILDLAAYYKSGLDNGNKYFDKLKGKLVITLFYENSTRTRTSFESAAKYLGAEVVNISVASSSVQKGESLKDTAVTLDAMKADVIIVRHSLAGTPQAIAGWVDAGVINGGDGLHAHPTQALLDVFTIKEKLGRTDGVKVAIIGDIKHSRVARSNIYAMSALGMSVNVYGPATLMPQGIDKLPCKVCGSMQEAVKDCDVIMTLRIQAERMKGGLLPALGEYSKCFGINRDLLKYAADDVMVMHPGPVNRGVELSYDVLDTDVCYKDRQVTSGLAVRMALLDMLTGGEL
ncbi:MAG: aspartate carbamoyltransferase catalytic subunit [Clostridia bacterium]|nr:aspartate carbamoyltransferase catalytic subunit [Clostridia bacterium]